MKDGATTTDGSMIVISIPVLSRSVHFGRYLRQIQTRDQRPETRDRRQENRISCRTSHVARLMSHVSCLYPRCPIVSESVWGVPPRMTSTATVAPTRSP